MTNHTPRSPHRSRRTLVRGIAAASAIAVALSLAASTGAAQWQALHEVEPLDADHVVLHLNGLVANHEPQGYRSRSEELPIELLIPEGSEVSPGDELLAVNAKVAETWSATRRLEIQEQELRLQLSRLAAVRDLQQLSAKRAEHEQQSQVLGARIEATREADEAKVEVARLKLQRAGIALEQAERHVERLQSLSHDVVNRKQLQQALDEFKRAREAVRVPQVELEYLETYTGAVSRRLLKQDLDAVTLELGGAQHLEGVFGEIEALREKQSLNDQVAREKLRRLHRQQQRDDQVIEDSAVRATAEGTLRYREDGLQIGQQSRRSSAIFVLRDQDMGFTFNLPVRWRNLVTSQASDRPDEGRVWVNVPQLNVRRAEGHVRSISALPHTGPTGRFYRCNVVLRDPLVGLKEGMRVDCAIRVAVPQGCRVVPAWSITDPRDPHVTMANGRQRRIEGRLIGSRFVVFSGLDAGERICARPRERYTKAVRLEGRVQARDTIHLKVPWRVEITDMVAEGTMVAEGQTIATTVQLRRDPTDERLEKANFIRQEAHVKFAIARIEADADRAKSHVAWRQAALAVDKARLERLIARYGSYEQEQVAGEVTLAEAQIELEASQRRLVELEALSDSGAVSEHDLRDARLQRDKAARAHAKASLGAVASQRQRDWLEVRSAEAALSEAQQTAEAKRLEYSLERENRQLRIARAALANRQAVAEAREIVSEADMQTVRAPIAGRVYYHFDDWGRKPESRPLKKGRALRTSRPFHMAATPQRDVKLEVPVQFHGRFTRGEQVPVQLSILGTEPVVGTVTSVSHHFHPSELAADETLTRATVGAPPMVFTIMIALSLSEEQVDRVPPGVNAWVELTP